MASVAPFQLETEITQIILNDNSFLSELDLMGPPTWQRQEVEDLFGIPDLVIAFETPSSKGDRQLRTVAFEMKRMDWKRALGQAFKYSAFAHYSCVVMDASYIHRAIANITWFERSNIGLLSASKDGKVAWHYRPHLDQPYSPRLQAKLEKLVVSDLERIMNRRIEQIEQNGIPHDPTSSSKAIA